MGLILVLLGALPAIIAAIREGISLLNMTPKDRDAVLAYLNDVEAKLDAAKAKVEAYTPIPKPE